MRLFLDTEFTNLRVPELLSLGIVSEVADEFYAELTFNRAVCSPFVEETVLPLLSNRPRAREEVADDLRSWLARFERPVVVYDSPTDWAMFLWLLGNAQVSVDGLLLDYDQWDWQRFEQSIDAYFEHHQTESRHHALHDARALRGVWLLMQP
ncbi:3'-5' exoribonuclease [Azospira sp. I09]|uniref:3'-5' exoribonuclease n=1 Tax=Azospira sp. I09 TaxID=1765049 RepID=UPI0012612F94|nr:3'-5' exoribonuclease [Azospira sp. I09]BBN89448.1 hypothetical protein AZSP09_24710 [Azospira sp. I09]